MISRHGPAGSDDPDESPGAADDDDGGLLVAWDRRQHPAALRQSPEGCEATWRIHGSNSGAEVLPWSPPIDMQVRLYSAFLSVLAEKKDPVFLVNFLYDYIINTPEFPRKTPWISNPNLAEGVLPTCEIMRSASRAVLYSFLRKNMVCPVRVAYSYCILVFRYLCWRSDAFKIWTRAKKITRFTFVFYFLQIAQSVYLHPGSGISRKSYGILFEEGFGRTQTADEQR